jgi:hypothetical protein
MEFSPGRKQCEPIGFFRVRRSTVFANSFRQLNANGLKQPVRGWVGPLVITFPSWRRPCGPIGLFAVKRSTVLAICFENSMKIVQDSPFRTGLDHSFDNSVITVLSLSSSLYSSLFSSLYPLYSSLYSSLYSPEERGSVPSHPIITLHQARSNVRLSQMSDSEVWSTTTTTTTTTTATATTTTTTSPTTARGSAS